MTKTILPLIILFLLSITDISAQVRKYSNEFLSLGVGARALGMGNVQTASVEDATAAYWNPAGLVGVKNFQVAAMHAEWFASIAKYDYLSLAIPIAENRTIGLSAIRFGVDDIPNTLQLVAPDGSINYDNLSSFSVADYGFLLSYAQSINNFSVGGNVKIIHRIVGDFATSWGFGIDLGAQYKINDALLLGLTIRDATTTFNSWGFNFTEEEKEVLAITDNIIPSRSLEQTGISLVPGIAYKAKLPAKLSLLTELDLGMTFDGERNVLIKSSAISIDPRIGLELAYDDFIFLRAGMNNIQQFTDDIDGTKFTSIQPNLGLGFKIREQVKIDYAFTGLNRVSDGVYSHVFSVLLNLGKKKNNDILRNRI